MTKSQVLVQNHKSWSSPDFPQNAFQEGLGLLYRMATCWSKPNHQPTGCIAHVGRQVAADRRWLMSVMTVTRTGAGHGQPPVPQHTVVVNDVVIVAARRHQRRNAPQNCVAQHRSLIRVAC